MQRIYYVKDPVTGEQLYSSDGTMVKMPYPGNRDEAIRDGFAKYYTLERCSNPRHVERVMGIYVKSGIRGCCVNEHATIEYNNALLRGEPTSSQRAVELGLDYFWVETAFSQCGHPGKATLKGTCYECHDARFNSPRQKAIRAGESWYQPADDDPCPSGHIAPRRVTNGSCQECERLSRPGRAKSEAQILMESCPDLILTRPDAVAMGSKVYRTGKECPTCGKAGWRYVSTGNCIACMGR